MKDNKGARWVQYQVVCVIIEILMNYREHTEDGELKKASCGRDI